MQSFAVLTEAPRWRAFKAAASRTLVVDWRQRMCFPPASFSSWVMDKERVLERWLQVGYGGGCLGTSWPAHRLTEPRLHSDDDWLNVQRTIFMGGNLYIDIEWCLTLAASRKYHDKYMTELDGAVVCYRKNVRLQLPIFNSWCCGCCWRRRRNSDFIKRRQSMHSHHGWWWRKQMFFHVAFSLYWQVMIINK